MKRYWFELEDKSGNDLGAAIPDSSSKQSGVNRAKNGWRRTGLRLQAL